MAVCAICLERLKSDPLQERGIYHSQCLVSLFGTGQLPRFELEFSELYRLASSKMAGKMSLSGAQEKVSLKLSPNHGNLTVAARRGVYILKPQSSRFKSLPQNEHLTMRLSQLVSIEVPPCGLLFRPDEDPAYIIKRFDRLDDGEKLQVEDFCQLAELPIRDKYDGSAEQCVRILRKYATEPAIEIQKFFRLLLFCWWTENGDMHLKNFSLMRAPDGIYRLSPAYDLVCTKLVIPEDSMALTIRGKRKKISRKHWLEFAKYCEIPPRAALRLIEQQIRAFEPAVKIVAASFLPEKMKNQYRQFVERNTRLLTE